VLENHLRTRGSRSTFDLEDSEMMAPPKLLVRIRMTPGRLLMRRIRTLAGIAAIGAGVLVAAGLTEMAAITSIAYA
jgi:hypothetical protein